jgi:hypothetical protein
MATDQDGTERWDGSLADERLLEAHGTMGATHRGVVGRYRREVTGADALAAFTGAGATEVSDYEVTWSGRGPLPGMSADGWQSRGNYLLDHAPGTTGWIHPDDPGLKNAPAAQSYNHKGAGRPVTNPNRTRRCFCGRQKSCHESRCTGCRLGKKQRTPKACRQQGKAAA